MKIVKYIMFMLSLLLTFSACTDDDKVTFNPNSTEPGKLNEIGASYVFEVEDAGNLFETFAWGKTTYNFDAAVTYTLQVDIQGKDFAGAEAVVSTSNLTADVTIGGMNAIMVKLLTKYELPEASKQNVEFRIKAAAGGNDETVVYYNVISTSITPYSAEIEYPGVHVMGKYSEWSWEAAQKLYSYGFNTTYEAWVFFDDKAAEGIKFAIPKEENGGLSWNDASNWGLKDGETPGSEASSLSLWSDGGSKDIKAYSKKYYNFSFDTSTGKLTNVNSMDFFGIIGSAVGGWEPTNDVAFDFDTEKQEFVAIATFVDGEIKFRSDKNWEGIDFGQKKDAASGILAKGGDNIAVTAGTYKVTVNLNNSNEMTYKIEAGTAIDPNKITPQVLNAHEDAEVNQNGSDAISWTALNFGDQDPATVNYTVEMDLKGAEFANVQTLGTTRETSLSVSGDKLLEALTALGKSIDTPTDVDVRVTATVSGITNVFTSNIVSYKLTVKTPPTYPTELYMTGEEFGNWFNEPAGVIKMIPVTQTEGAFWCIKYFSEGKQFKWAPQMGWGNDFAELDEKIGYTTSGGNAIVAADGLYVVYIDMVSRKIAIEPAEVYGMGNAFGNWDMGANAFTIDGSKASFVATSNTTTDGGLRTYAKSSLAPAGDWWKMEFVIKDGKIVYRAGGGDPENIPVTAGQTITYDFKTDTGTIE